MKPKKTKPIKPPTRGEMEAINRENNEFQAREAQQEQLEREAVDGGNDGEYL